MKTKGSIQMKKSNALAITLSAVALLMSAAALAIGIVALVKSCAGKRITAAEYNCFAQSDDSEDEENIGSDTLAF